MLQSMWSPRGVVLEADPCPVSEGIICGLPESGGPPPHHAFLSGAGWVDRSRRRQTKIPANPSRMPGNRSASIVAGPTTRQGPWSRHHSGPRSGFRTNSHTRLLCRSISVAASPMRSGSSDRELNSWRREFMKVVMSTAAASISASGRSNFSEACLRNLSRRLPIRLT